MHKLLATMMLAAPLFALTVPAHAKPRKVSVTVAATPAPAVVAATPAAQVTVASAAPAPAVAVAAPTATVAVTAPAPVVAVGASTQHVAVSGGFPMAAVQMQVNADPGYQVAVAPAPVAVYQAAPSCNLRSEGEFQGVVAAIRNESFSSDQLRVLGDASQGSCCTVAQVEQIIPLFSFEADQLKALRIMAARIVDRQNTFRIYGLFTFENGKKEARRILAQ